MEIYVLSLPRSYGVPPLLSDPSLVRRCPGGPENFFNPCVPSYLSKEATLHTPMLSQYKGSHSEDAWSDRPTQTRCGFSVLR